MFQLKLAYETTLTLLLRLIQVRYDEHSRDNQIFKQKFDLRNLTVVVQNALIYRVASVFIILQGTKTANQNKIVDNN